MGEKEGFGEIGWEADRTEEKNPPAACLVKKQNNGSHQENLKKFPLKAYRKHQIFQKKVAKTTTFNDIYFFYDQQIMLK